MKKEKAKNKYLSLIIATIILLLLASVVGLVYWKVGRVIKSFSDSAQKAASQNTPLSD